MADGEGKEGAEVKPDTKPKTEPIVDSEVVVEEKPTAEMMSVPKEEFNDLQKQLLGLQTKVDASEKAKEDIERTYAFNELKTLNPKLAEINKKASTSTLKTVIETAKEMKAGFPSLGAKKPDEQKASINDHDSMDYDFVKKDWTYQ